MKGLIILTMKLRGSASNMDYAAKLGLRLLYLGNRDSEGSFVALISILLSWKFEVKQKIVVPG
jgi:hypothetical protein